MLRVRLSLVKSVAVGLLASAFLAPAPAHTAVTDEAEYRLKLFHLHTGERLDVVYRKGDHYVPGALESLDRYLRD